MVLYRIGDTDFPENLVDGAGVPFSFARAGENAVSFKPCGDLIHAQALQFSDVFQAVQRVAGKPADRFGDDHVNVTGMAFFNHAIKLITLFGVCAGDAVVYVNAVFDTREIPNKQGLSAVLLRRKPSFFMPVFSFSATLPARM